MKPKILTFLKVGLIISIVLSAVVVLITLISGLIGFIAGLIAVSDGGDVAAVILSFVGSLVSSVFCAAAGVVSIVLTSIARKKIIAAKNKTEARPAAIMAIIAGVLFGIFQIPAGIIALACSEESFNAESK